MTSWVPDIWLRKEIDVHMKKIFDKIISNFLRTFFFSSNLSILSM